MKRIIVLLSIGLTMACTSRSQEKPSFKFLLIAPTKTSIDPAFQKQADSIVSYRVGVMTKGGDDPKKWKDLSQAERRSVESFLRFLKKPDIFKLTSVAAAEALHLNLSYMRGFEDIQLQFEDVATDNKAELKRLAASNGVSYVVSFPEVAFYQQNGELNLKLHFQVYDLASDSILLRKEFAGNEFEPIAEDYCGSKTMSCLLTDGNAQVAAKIINAIATVHPALMAQEQKFDRDSTLRAQRDGLLRNKYFIMPWDGSLARSVIDPRDSSINLADMFHCFQNEEKTRFLALFARNATKEERKELYVEDTSSEMVVYMVRGMLYNGQWYYETMYGSHNTKSGGHFIAGVDVENGRPYFFTYLKDLEFFTEDDTTFNKNFWESGPFGKIKDLTKDPKWEELKDSWKYREHEDRDYIGMYEIIANKLKDSVDNVRNKFKAHIFEKYIKPRTGKNFDPLYVDEPELYLFFTKDQTVALGAYVTTDNKGQRTLRYYVVLPNTNEVYEWTKLSRVLKKDEYAGRYIHDQIYSVAKEDIENDDLLEDHHFWNKHVLLKENGKYKYLKPLSSIDR